MGLVHGQQKPDLRDATMARFAAGELDVLVATTVVEVGIDVPNASVMLIEDAERFGLAQLHQLRGRVGRGPHRSFCILLS
ncbi:MAG: ATP-dependent DNA helicase RecG, partial [Chloroflexi bacterium]